MSIAYVFCFNYTKVSTRKESQKACGFRSRRMAFNSANIHTHLKVQFYDDGVYFNDFKGMHHLSIVL